MSESELESAFLEEGYVIEEVADSSAYERIEAFIREEIAQFTGNDVQSLAALENIISVESINSVRLHVYRALNAKTGFLEDYFSIFRPYVERLVGTELACQNRVNLSIQLPHDDTSRIGLHTDTVSGQSEFEVVAWLPFTPVHDTNSMYVFGIEGSQKMLASLPEYQTRGMEALYEDWKHKASFLELEPGQCLVFSSTLMHGNVVNETSSTRVSLNGRYKSLFSPYNRLPHSEKKLGNFYMPFRVSPVTRLALNYEEPDAQF